MKISFRVSDTKSNLFLSACYARVDYPLRLRFIPVTVRLETGSRYKCEIFKRSLTAVIEMKAFHSYYNELT